MGLPEIDRTVLVTGCSTGIGRSTAQGLRERGWTVYPTARTETDLASLREEGFEAVPLDVAEADSVAACVETVLGHTGGTLGAVVNNAGFGQAGALEDLSRGALERQFAVNVFGLQDLTNRLVPVFREAGAGRIVQVSSVVGRMSLPFLGAYCASKFAVEAMGDAQRIELRGSGVHLSIIEPGPIITAFRKTCAEATEAAVDPSTSAYGDMYMKELDRRKQSQKKVNFINRPPEAVAAKVVHALESGRPKRRYCVTLPAYAGAWMRRFAPYAVTDALLGRQVKKKDP